MAWCSSASAPRRGSRGRSPRRAAARPPGPSRNAERRGGPRPRPRRCAVTKVAAGGGLSAASRGSAHAAPPPRSRGRSTVEVPRQVDHVPGQRVARRGVAQRRQALGVGVDERLLRARAARRGRRCSRGARRAPRGQAEPAPAARRARPGAARGRPARSRRTGARRGQARADRRQPRVHVRLQAVDRVEHLGRRTRSRRAEARRGGQAADRRQRRGTQQRPARTCGHRLPVEAERARSRAWSLPCASDGREPVLEVERQPARRRAPRGRRRRAKPSSMLPCPVGVPRAASSGAWATMPAISGSSKGAAAGEDAGSRRATGVWLRDHDHEVEARRRRRAAAARGPGAATVYFRPNGETCSRRSRVRTERAHRERRAGRPGQGAVGAGPGGQVGHVGQRVRDRERVALGVGSGRRAIS